MESTQRQLAKIGKAKSSAVLMERRNELARQAMMLRRRGLDYYQIAEKLGISAQEAQRTVAESIKEAASLVDAATKTELLYMEVSRLDAMMSYVWDDVEAGDVRAGEFALKLIQERIKAMGLSQAEAQTTVNAVVVPTSEEEYAAALRLIASGGVRQ